MKLIKQVSLYFQEGRSDKVYEVDLCEVGPGQYVVNFRYGRRGTALNDGSKTLAPVPLAEAERIFDQLVESKTRKGYRHTPPTGVPIPPAAPPSGAASQPAAHAAARVLDPRSQAVLARLAQGHEEGGGWRLSRAVWRAGELRLREAEPLLPGLIGSGDAMLDYCIAWALAQCGSAASIPALHQLQSNRERPFMVRRMAAEALLQLSDEQQRARAIAGYIKQLPEPLPALAADGPAERFQEALLEYLAGGDHKAYMVLGLVYFIDNEHVRPALLHVLRTAPLAPNYFRWMRQIFKVAELRRDGEVFGILAYRFETTRSKFRTHSYSYSYSQRAAQKPTVGAQAQKAFGHETRFFFRRRVWRTLRWLGELDDLDYVRMAVGVLLPFTDDDAKPPGQVRRYDWSSYSSSGRYTTITTHWDRFAGYWALNQVLYQNSPRYQPDRGKRNFYCVPPFEPGGPEPPQREEAFPHLWERRPHALLHLLDRSRCEPVHRFGVKALRACQQFCREMDVNALLMLLGAPYDVTVELGFDLAVARYDPVHPDRRLVLALANCGVERARQKAHSWIRAQRSFFFEDNDFVAALVGSPHADTRAFARESLQGITLSATAAEALIGRLIALLQSFGEGEGEIARDVADTLLRTFTGPMRQIGPEVIRDLLGHPLPEVQRFAGELVLGHATLAQRPPDDVLRALLNAGTASVREIGVRIIGQLPGEVLKRSVALLVALSTHGLADVREAIRPVVARLATDDGEFGRRIGELLVEAILVPGAPEGVPSHTARILREDLRGHLGSIPAETVWKLLQSRSSPAQEVGGLLLATNVRPENLSVKEIVKLASHDILTVREAAWQMSTASVQRMRAEMDDAIRILDAKWADSRQFAFRLFRENFTEADLAPAVLVSICDSVRPDVEQFGREMITRCFQEPHGQEYLLKLSEHPSTSLQLFATNFMERFAVDDPQRLRELEPYFVSVLSRVNKGRVAKERIFAFLEREALKSEEAARVVAGILTRQSATCAIGNKASAIETMVRIRAAYPAISLPLKTQPVEARGGV